MRFINNITYLDNFFLLNIFELRGKSPLSAFLPWISHSANGYYYPLLAVFLMFFDPAGVRSFLVAGLVAFAIELPVYKILKNVIKRSRPFEVLNNISVRILPSDRFSLPSGHTAAAFLIALLLGYYYPVLTLPAFLWASLVGISRIFLGVHYPTDVLAGIALGILSGMAGIQLVGRLI